MRIGVIGCGVVGNAVLQGVKLCEGVIKAGVQVVGYDKYLPGFSTIEDVLDTTLVFLCLPTATQKDGTQDLSPLHETFAILKAADYRGTIVVKSTVIPGTTEALAAQYGLANQTCHNPEFLTAASPLRDFMAQPYILLGGPTVPVEHAAALYQLAGFDKILKRHRAAYSEMAKYMHNLFLSVKVMFFNEMYDACTFFALDYQDALSAALAIGQIGNGHTRVPGPDGQMGFGGMCFPKDTKAFLTHGKEQGIQLPVLEATVAANNVRRPEEA